MTHAEWMEGLGVRFETPALLTVALTHPSLPREPEEPDNQRLEFLGDAVLELCVSRALYALHPSADEGSLTRMRSVLVREETLSAAARRLGLGDHLRMAHGERLNGGHEKPSILADALEALLAAIYLDQGLESAADFAAKALDGYALPEEADTTNWKSLLQETVQARGLPSPQYELIACEGPPHAPRFTAIVACEGRRLGQGEGKSKKEAEQQAARAAIKSGGAIVAPEEA